MPTRFHQSPGRPPLNARQLSAMAGAALCGVLMGGVVATTRYVVPQSDPLTVSMLRYLLGLLSIAPCFLLFRQRPILRRDLAPILLLGSLFFGLVPYLFTISLKYTYASHGGLMIATVPLLTLGLSALLRVEQPGLFKLGGLLLGIGGALVSLWAVGGAGLPRETLWLGDALMFLSMAGFAVFNVYSRPYLIRYGPLQFTTIAVVPGAFSLIAVWLAAGGGLSSLEFSLAGWAAILFIGIPGGAWGFLLFIAALRHLSPARAAVFFNLNPLTAAGLGAWALGEALSGRFLVGFALVLCGILLAQLGGRQGGKEPQPEGGRSAEGATGA